MITSYTTYTRVCNAAIILITSLIPLFLIDELFNFQSEPPTERVRHIVDGIN